MTTVRLPATFHKYAGGAERVPAAGNTVGEVLRDVVAAHPDLEERLFDSYGKVRNHLSVVVDDRIIKHGDVDRTLVSRDDEIVILVALAGGA